MSPARIFAPLFLSLTLLTSAAGADPTDRSNVVVRNQAIVEISTSEKGQMNKREIEVTIDIFQPRENSFSDPTLIDFWLRMGARANPASLRVLDIYDIKGMKRDGNKIYINVDEKRARTTYHSDTGVAFQQMVLELDESGSRIVSGKILWQEISAATGLLLSTSSKVFEFQKPVTLLPEEYSFTLTAQQRGFVDGLAYGDFRVFEMGTVNPVRLSEFFDPKGIHFPGVVKSATPKKIKSKPASTPIGSNSSWSSSYYSSISSAKDVKLKGALETKQDLVWALLQSTDKPTMDEFLKMMGGADKLGDKNPFDEYISSTSSLIEAIQKELPEVIVQMEAAFPNAIWYGLGRDIYLLSDALDTYYISQGQPGRVRRLHASQPSFNENNVKEVAHFLRSNDFKFENLENEPARIIFDITSYSKGYRYSQSSQLMRAAYRELMANNVDPQLAFQKVNFISVTPGPNNIQMRAGFDFIDFFESLKVDTDNAGPKKILQTRNISAMNYTDAWHGLYGRFHDENGKIVTSVGEPATERTKLKLLGEMWVLAKHIYTPSFQTKVEDVAFKYIKASSYEECIRLLE